MSRHPYVGLGYISGVYGVRGWVKVFSYTQPREQILDYKQWYIGPDRSLDSLSAPADAPTQLEAGRIQGKGIVARLAGIDDRDAAGALIGCGIFVERASLPDIQPGEYYWADLEGLRVCTTRGQELGRVDHLMETGAHDVLVLDGGANRLIPFVAGKVVVDVDLSRGVIEVDWDPAWWE